MPDTQARQDATMPDTHVGQDATMPDTHASEEAASSEPQGNGCAPLVDFDIQTATAAKGFGFTMSKKERPHGKTTEKVGNMRVMEDGTMTYKKADSNTIMEGIQFGLRVSIGSITSKERSDILMQDFEDIERTWCPSSGTTVTPAHSTADFTFKAYAPHAFRYFREAFGIKPADFLVSLCNEPLKEVSNPGASGALFFLTPDDNFILKTVQKKEANFLRKLLPGYFLNMTQNTKTLLTKFFGLYCYKTALGRNIRFVIMNNILPTNIAFKYLFDLKGSTHRRLASLKERGKTCPTFKDLDYRDMHSVGIRIERQTYDALKRTLERDCRVLQSFRIMDYSLLVGIHFLSIDSLKALQESSQSGKSAYSFSSVTSSMGLDAGSTFSGGVLGFTETGQPVLVFVGIIDILQQYKIPKKMEHACKALMYDGKAVSVCHPKLYAARFQKFKTQQVFVPVDKEQADVMFREYFGSADAEDAGNHE